jgi:hypothetical protein
MKGKPNKWGYKIFALAGQSGYIYRFQVAGDNTLDHTYIEPEIGKSGQVVMELTESVPPGTQLYFDNWFCSPLLIKKFGELQLGATGTVRQNRKAGCPLMSEKALKKEGRGAYDFKSANGVVVCDWYDNRVVTVASNFHSVQPVSMQSRWSKKDNSYINIPCPNLITAYNKSMGGVDRCDMMLALYRMKMKGRKWYKRLFFHFVDLAVINAWTILRQTNSPQLKLVNFKMEVAVALIKGGLLLHPMAAARLSRGIRGAAGDVSGGGDADDEEEEGDQSAGSRVHDPQAAGRVNKFVRYDGMHHLPRKVAKLPKACRMELCKRRSRMFCVKCQVYLCVDEKSDCFLRFHQKP